MTGFGLWFHDGKQIDLDCVLVAFTHADAYHILSDRKLSPRSKRIADHWLSLWEDDDLPPRQAISPAPLKDLLPALIFFEVVPGHSVRVRMAGTDFGHLLKFELTGRDWLAVTPQQDRAERLAVFSAVAEGAIAVNRWTFPHYWLGETVCEKLLLPLRPRPGADTVPILGFIERLATGSQLDCEADLSAIPLPQILNLTFFRKGGRVC